MCIAEERQCARFMSRYKASKAFLRTGQPHRAISSAVHARPVQTPWEKQYGLGGEGYPEHTGLPWLLFSGGSGERDTDPREA